MIAWLWARTVASPNPAARGARVPLVSTFMLSTKTGKEAWVEPVLDPGARDGYRFDIRTGKADPATLDRTKKGTQLSRGANFLCLLTGAPITPAHIKAEGKSKRMGSRLMAVVAEGKRGRVDLPTDQEHERVAVSAKSSWYLDQPMSQHPQYMGVAHYGFRTFGDLFTSRQLVALKTFSDLVTEAHAIVCDHARAALAACSQNETEERVIYRTTTPIVWQSI